MDTMKNCPGCQKPLAPNAPDGLCPECLIKAGLGTGVDIGPDSQAESGRIPFVAPPAEEMARLFPQLEILGFIGQGGMGAVYKARQKALDRIVALKILPPGIGNDPAFKERFTREARALARLNHPGIVTLYEFGQADGLFFFLMEFVDGVSLRYLLEGERVSAREALAIVPQICDALQYAHDQRIVHRDIKPENILLDRQGRVKVADFGLAKLVGQDGESSASSGISPGAMPTLTASGKVMGTPQYMAPEQREHPTEVDHRADIYSLGVVFYQMLTGELPGKPIEAPSHKVQIDVRLDEVVLRAMEKDPELRYQQVSEVKTRVETIAATPRAGSSGRESAPTHSAGDLGRQALAGAVPPRVSPNRFWRRFALALALVVLAPILILVGVALLGIIAGVLSRARHQPQQVESSVTASTNAAPAVAPQTLTFGPVIETLIATADANDQGLVFFDMETGKSFKPPFPLTFQPNQGPVFVELTPELKEWIKARGVDLLLHLGETNWDMMRLGMQEEFAGQLNEWKTISPEKVIGIFAKEDEDHLVRDEVPASSFGYSYRGEYGSVTAFRTRRNAMGVYQIQGMGNINRRGVGIRYKLVQSSPDGAASPSADTRRFPATLLVIGGPSVRATTMPLTAPMGQVRFMLSNEVAAVNWEFLKTTPTGDMYRFTRKIPAEPTDYSGYPAYEGEQQIATKEAVYTGRELVIWQDEQQRIALKPDEAGSRAQGGATRKASTVAGSRSRTFSLRHRLASEMDNDLGKILLGRVGMEARPAPDNMQLTVTAPSDVLNRVSTFVAVTDWPKRIAPGKDYSYPREDAEQAGRSFFYACSIEDVEGVTRMLAPRVLAELKGTNLTAQGVRGEEKDEELVRQLRGKWEGKEAAVRRVVQAWNRFPLRKLQVEGKSSIGRYFASAAFEGAPVEWVELSFVPDRSPKTKREPHFGPPGPLMIDTLPPWFGEKEAGVKGSQPVPEKPQAGDSGASKAAAAQAGRLKLEEAQAAGRFARADRKCLQDQIGHAVVSPAEVGRNPFRSNVEGTLRQLLP